MENKRLKNKSRYLSKLLRWDPEDLIMDSSGYVKVLALCHKLDITKSELDWIIENNDKKRFSYNENESLIRANQGHNKDLNIEVEMEEAERIDFLYHGTAKENVKSILKDGLVPRNRKHVHLSNDLKTAKNVGSRHSKNIVILIINSAKMRADGVKIYISKNDVHLTDYVDPKYITLQ